MSKSLIKWNENFIHRFLPISADFFSALWEFRGLTPDVRAGLVPAQCGATTRVARTPRNPEDPFFLIRAIRVNPCTYFRRRAVFLCESLCLSVCLCISVSSPLYSLCNTFLLATL
jgi:hypothetical protein